MIDAQELIMPRKLLIALLLAVLVPAVVCAQAGPGLLDLAALIGVDREWLNMSELQDATAERGGLFGPGTQVLVSGTDLPGPNGDVLPVNVYNYAADGMFFGLVILYAHNPGETPFPKKSQTEQQAIYKRMQAAVKAGLGGNVAWAQDDANSVSCDGPDRMRYAVAWLPGRRCEIRIGPPQFLFRLALDDQGGSGQVTVSAADLSQVIQPGPELDAQGQPIEPAGPDPDGIVITIDYLAPRVGKATKYLNPAQLEEVFTRTERSDFAPAVTEYAATSFMATPGNETDQATPAVWRFFVRDGVVVGGEIEYKPARGWRPFAELDGAQQRYIFLKMLRGLNAYLGQDPAPVASGTTRASYTDSAGNLLKLNWAETRCVLRVSMPAFAAERDRTGQSN
jgi:hypothetical protein